MLVSCLALRILHRAHTDIADAGADDVTRQVAVLTPLGTYPQRRKVSVAIQKFRSCIWSKGWWSKLVEHTKDVLTACSMAANDTPECQKYLDGSHAARPDMNCSLDPCTPCVRPTCSIASAWLRRPCPSPTTAQRIIARSHLAPPLGEDSRPLVGRESVRERRPRDVVGVHAARCGNRQ